MNISAGEVIELALELTKAQNIRYADGTQAYDGIDYTADVLRKEIKRQGDKIQEQRDLIELYRKENIEFNNIIESHEEHISNITKSLDYYKEQCKLLGTAYAP